MQLSYWEIKNWFTDIDFTIIGSGIVGLHTALNLREKYPNSKIVIIEKGVLPQGASTKNAGFACFGTISEINEYLKTHTEEEIYQLIEKRWTGLQLLRKRIGDNKLNYKPFGGYELYLNDDEENYQESLSKIDYINQFLKPIFKADVFQKEFDRFGFKNCKEYLIYTPFEGSIDTGNLMQALLKEAIANDILILNQQKYISHQDLGTTVEVQLENYTFKTKKLFFATNAFASEIFPKELKPARAQVLITKPLPNLDIKGTFHIDKGYYYFRNVENRILLGGARNLDFEAETTYSLNTSDKIQNKLEEILQKVILPNTAYEIDHRWSGTMGIGPNKNPLLTSISPNVFCGVRLNGTGIAIGSLVGQELANFI